MPQTTGPNWRAATRSSQRIQTIPDWLVKARAFKGNPSARHIAELARKITMGFNVRILIGGDEVKEAGMAARLGNISRKEAYKVLVAIAESGRHPEAVTIALEDAASLLNARLPINVSKLEEIFRIREFCMDATLAGLDFMKDAILLQDLSGAGIYKIMETLEREYEGRMTLMKVLADFSTVGWELLYNRAPGKYEINQVIADVI